MYAKYILAAIAVLFCVLTVMDVRKSGKLSAARKTQLMIAAIFFLVAALLQFGFL